MAPNRSDPHLEQLRASFETAWREGREPQIETYLSECAAEEREPLLRLLLTAEVELRMRAGQAIRAAEYVERFADQPEVVWSVLSRAETIVGGEEGSPSPAVIHESPLALSPFFRAVPAEVLLAHMYPREYSPGEALIRQGDVSDELVLISEGEVEISSLTPEGRRIVIDRSHRGDVLGEMALLTSEPRLADAVAIDHVRALVLPAAKFHELARTYPELSHVLTEVLARRLGVGSRDALIDKELDGYRVIRRLGRGGMGIVYQAQELSTGRTVALKMLSHRLIYDEEAAARFQREAEIVQRLAHENIIQILGRFEAFRTYFLVLEFCHGRTLEELVLEEGRLPEGRVRAIAGQLASALAAAHRAGVAHGDVKPANVMLTGSGLVKLMDFGLAEPAAKTTKAAQRIVGTPRYMAPERRRGQRASPEGDWFSFACVVYELLLAQPLFRGTDEEELRRDFRAWQPPDLARLCPGLSPDFVEALEAAFAADPARRRLDFNRLAAWSPSLETTRVFPPS